MKKRMITVATLALLLSACGTVRADRTLSGAMIGAGAGLAVGGPGGAAVGGVAGAATGYVTNRNQIYLGRPIWKN